MKEKKKLYFMLLLLAATITTSKPFCDLEQHILDSFSDDKENPDENEAKILCKFKNYEHIRNNDVITIIDESDSIYSILGLDSEKKSNDTYIYLPKGEYRIYSSLGLDKTITIDDVDSTYELVCSYEDNVVRFKKIYTEYKVKKQTNINDNENTNYISNELNFLNNIESFGLDYSNIKNDEFTPQGYVIIGGTYPSILISAYSKDDNSRIYIYDKQSGSSLGYISLNNTNHVGGITYDSSNDILFVTAYNGKIETYDYSVLMQALNNGREIIDGDVVINLVNKSDKTQNNDYAIIDNDLNVLQTAATICYYDKALYSIDYGQQCVLVKTKYDIVDGKIVSTDNKVIIPEDAKCVQGMAFYRSNKKTYLVLSTSSGVLQSEISVYEVDDTYNWKCISKKIIESSKQIEGISVDMYGNISTIYEGKITNSKIVGNVEVMLRENTYEESLINNIGYNVSGFMWDIENEDDMSLNKAKRLIKSQ